MTPTGSPAWLRLASYAHYGGDVNKHNFLSQGSIDPTTDISAEEHARLAADMEAVARTCPFAVITYLNNDSSPAAPTIQSVYMMTGVRSTTYAGDAAPTGFPSAARNGTGDVTFTFDSSYTDPYSVSGAFSISHVGTGVQSTTAATAVPEIATSTTVRVRCFAAGVATGDKRVTIEVW